MKVASTQELNHAKQYLLEDEIDLAIKEFRKLYNKYPSDNVILYELGTLLLRQGTNVSEALYLLKLAINKHNKYAINNDIGLYYLKQSEFDKAKEKFTSLLESEKDSYKCYGYYGLIKVYLHTEEYEEALECFKKMEKIRNATSFTISHFYNLKFYLLFKNGLMIDETRADNYFRKQLVDYNKEEVIEHIKEHLQKLDEESKRVKKFHSVFNEEIDVVKLYDYCLDDIQDKKPSGYGVVDYYKCKLNEKIGSTYTNKETTSVEVVTFPNSKAILSIYPVYEKHVNKVVEKKEEERKIIQNQKTHKKKTYKKNKKNHL